MEQRNEMLQRMRMTERQKRGDVQHLLARSFSTKQTVSHDHLAPPPSPPREIFIPVPQLPRVQVSLPPSHSISTTVEEVDSVSIGDLSVEPRVAGGNAIPLVPITEELGIETGEEMEGGRKGGREGGRG